MKLYSDLNQFIISTVDGQSRIFLHNTDEISALFCICSVKRLMKFKAVWQYACWKGMGGKKNKHKNTLLRVFYPTLLIVLDFVLK